VAEYCCPVWACSAHADLVDAQLISTMRLISYHWDIALCITALATSSGNVNIEPPVLRHKAAEDRLIEETAVLEDWPLHEYVFSPPCNCLPSCTPLWTDTHPIDVTSQWQDDWKSASVVSSFLVDDPAIQRPGFDLLQ